MQTRYATYAAVKSVETVDGESVTSVRVIPEKKFDKENTERVEKGQQPIEADSKQTFLCYEAETLSEFVETLLKGNEKEALNLALRGYDLKVQQAIRETMSEDNFTPVDGVYDTLDFGAEERQRRTADPVARALKGQLKNLNADKQAEILAKIQDLLAQANAQ